MAGMLKTQLLHPQIWSALGRAGHGSRVLIADGNFPHATRRGPGADLVFLNLAPDLLRATDVLRVVAEVIPIEAATVMDTLKTGPYAMTDDPPIWREFEQILAPLDVPMPLARLERETFYQAAESGDVCLTIATGERRVYANLLLTIGVVR